jgi:hypothetical protein
MKSQGFGSTSIFRQFLMRAGIILLLVLLISTSLSPVTSIAANIGPIGMVADNAGYVHIFDAGSNTVLGTISIPVDEIDGVIGDCSVSRDGTLGFVTNFDSKLWVIDLTKSPPVLASGNNPITISNYGEDMSITPDGNYVLVVDGNAHQPISVVDITSQTEKYTFTVESNHNSIDVLSDGSVLVTEVITALGTEHNRVYRLTIDSAGNLTDTTEMQTVDEPLNVYGSPNAKSGFVVSLHGIIQSFTIPGLTLVDTRNLPDIPTCGVMHPAGNKIYLRTTDRNSIGNVIAYTFDSITGAIGNSPLFFISVEACNNYYGIDQMAITPDGNRLYVSEKNLLNVYSANTGALLDTISDSNFGSLTGVSFGPARSTPRGVGGEIKQVNKFSLIIPWLSLILTLMIGVIFFVLVRRKGS